MKEAGRPNSTVCTRGSTWALRGAVNIICRIRKKAISNMNSGKVARSLSMVAEKLKASEHVSE